jgi:hypothetical protein
MELLLKFNRINLLSSFEEVKRFVRSNRSVKILHPAAKVCNANSLGSSRLRD